MALAQGNNMKIINTAIILLLVILQSACDNNSGNQNDNLHVDTNEPSLSADDIQSKNMLAKATNALNNVEDAFQWRDTHILLQKSQKALSDGDFKLSSELSQTVIQQSKLMNEQKEFADNHWQDLIPKK